jgi:hypothetical protein
LCGQLKDSYLPSSRAFLSGVLTQGSRDPGEVKDKPLRGVTSGADLEVLGGVEGVFLTGGRGASLGVPSSPSALVAIGMVWSKYITSMC